MNQAHFQLSSDQCSILVDDKDDWIVQHAAQLLQQDILAVTGKRLEIINHLSKPSENCIIIGSIKHSGFVSTLNAEHKIQIQGIKGQWEAFQLQVIDDPFKGISKALVIAGSDKRGAAYGVFELSKQMGVSPWYWWADVPVKKKQQFL